MTVAKTSSFTWRFCVRAPEALGASWFFDSIVEAKAECVDVESRMRSKIGADAPISVESIVFPTTREDRWRWMLDRWPVVRGGEINPEVAGYQFDSSSTWQDVLDDLGTQGLKDLKAKVRAQFSAVPEELINGNIADVTLRESMKKARNKVLCADTLYELIKEAGDP